MELESGSAEGGSGHSSVGMNSDAKLPLTLVVARVDILEGFGDA